jgi:uncharacterized protein (UPF0248 family)
MNTSTSSNPILIEKEQVAGLHFPEEDVLQTNDEKTLRLNSLDRAMKLGNLEHNKIKLIFADDTSVKQVETTVWGVTDRRIILKQGVVIPIHRIIEIR